MKNLQQSNLEALADEMLLKPKKSNDDIIQLLSSFIKFMLPEKIEENKGQKSATVAQEEKISDDEEKVVPHAEKLDLPLKPLKTRTSPKRLSRSVKKQHKTLNKFASTSHSSKSNQRGRTSMRKSMTNGNDIIRESCKKLKMNIRRYKMHDGFQDRRNDVWACALDDRELMKFKFD